MRTTGGFLVIWCHHITTLCYFPPTRFSGTCFVNNTYVSPPSPWCDVNRELDTTCPLHHLTSPVQVIISPGDGTNFPKEGDKLTMHYQ
jgi:hypothetical protein